MPDDSSPLRRRRRRLAVLLLAATLLLSAVAYVSLERPLTRRAHRAIVTHLHRATGGAVDLDGLELHVLPPGVSWRRLAIRDGRGTVRSLEASGGTIVIDVGSLLAGRVRPRAITIDAVDVELARGPEPAPTAPAGVAPAEMAAWGVALDRLVIGEGRLRWRDESIDFRLDARGVTARLAPTSDGVAGPIAAGPIEMTVSSRRLDWRRFAAQARWRAPHLDLERIAFEAEHASGRGSARIAAGGDRVTLDATLSVDVGLGALALDERGPRGLVALEGTVRADSRGRYRAELKARTGAGGLQYGRLETVQATMSLLLDEEEWRIEDARLSAAGGSLELADGRLVVTGDGAVAEGRLAVVADARLRQLVPGPWPEFEARLALRAELDRLGRPIAWSARGGGGPRGGPPGAAFAIDASGDERGARGEVTGSSSSGARFAVTARARRRDFGGWSWSAEGRADTPTAAASRAEIDRALRALRAVAPAQAAPLAAIPIEAVGAGSGWFRASGEGDRLEDWAAGIALRGVAGGGFAFERVELGAAGRGTKLTRARARAVDERGRGLHALASGPRPIARWEVVSDGIGVDPLLARLAGGLPWPVADPSASVRVAFAAAGGGPLAAVPARVVAGVTAPAPDGAPVSGFAVARAGARAIDLPLVSLHAPGGAARGRLVLALDPWRGLASSSGAVAAEGRLGAWGAASGVGARGRFTARARWQDLTPHAAPAVEGELAWDGVDVEGFSVPAGRLIFEPAPDGTRFATGIAGVDVSGAVSGPLVDPAIALRAAWRDVELMQALEHLRGTALPLAVRIWTGGHLSLSGPLRAPHSWIGRGSLDDVEILGTGLTLDLDAPVPLFFSLDGQLGVDPGHPMRLVSDEGTELVAWGRIALAGERRGAVALEARGEIPLAAAEVLDPDVIGAGVVALAVRVQGRADDPTLAGRLGVAGGSIRHLRLGDSVEEIAADVVLEGRRARIERGAFQLGGGRVEVSGGCSWSSDGVELDLSFDARDVALRKPKGFWGRYDARLHLGGTFLDPAVGGRVDVLAARFSGDLAPRLLGRARARALEPTWSTASWAARWSLDVSVEAPESIAVRTDLARLEAGARLRILGSLALPEFNGRVGFVPGGTISFRDQEFEIVDGELLLDDSRGEPRRIRISATTRVREYQIRLDLDASTRHLDYRLTSAPALPQADVLALLLTGQTLSESGSGLSQGLEGEMAAAYFGTQLGELLLGGAARRVFGLSRFQISPTRLGPEASPTARVTIGRRLDEQTTVLYSRDLSAQARDVYLLERAIGRSWRVSLGREPLGGLGVDLRWLRRFRAAPARAHAGATDPSRPRLEEVVITGWPGRPPRPKQLGLKRGRPISRAQVVAAREALAARLVEQGWLQARVHQEETGDGTASDGVVIRFRVETGPKWLVRTRGPEWARRHAREELVEIWSQTAFRPSRLDELERVLREAFADEGYATAVVDLERPDPDRREIVVTVDPGPRVRIARVAVRGVSALPREAVEQQVLSRPSGWLGKRRVIYRPRVLQDDLDAIRTLYESRGYLDVVVTESVRFTPAGDAVEVAIDVREGEPSRIGTVRVTGDWPADLGSPVEVAGLERGEIFRPSELRAAERRLRERLDRAGYADAAVTARADPHDGTVDVALRVAAGRPAVVAEVRFEGLRRTQRRLVERAVALEVGEPLARERLRETERALYALGLFRDVSIRTEAVAVPQGVEQRRVVIAVEEANDLTLLAGAGYDTEEKGQASLSLTDENLDGRGRIGSVQLFHSSLRSSARVTLEDRHVARDRLEALLTTSWERERRDGFTASTLALGAQIGTKPVRSGRWQLRYALEQSRIADVTLSQESLLDVLRSDRRLLEPVRLGGLIGSWIDDRRDDPFLPRDGSVLRTELGVWLRPLASEVEFGRWSGQYARYRPVGERLVAAASIEVGLARPLGEREIPLQQRFFAGGADSLRGFARDAAGPLDPVGREPLGGESLLVANLELRYRVAGRIDLVLFADGGNVWRRLSDFATDLREVAGAGLRFNTPVGALRVEYGHKLDRRPGESPGQVVFSIGESF